MNVHPNLKLLSHSSEQLLNTCPRKYQIYKLRGVKDRESTNDTLFGHAVGEGIQTLIETKNRNKALWAAFMGWKDDFRKTDLKAVDSNKTADFIPVAIDAFMPYLQETFKGWEIAHFNGKPAKELSFSVDFGDGFYFRGYVDLVLYNPSLNLFLVLELKTTKLRNVDEATYANSMQGLGYGVLLDTIARSLGLGKPSSYEVLYLVYKSTSFAWEVFPFKKSLLKRIQWLQHILAQIERIKIYESLGYWPMHGESCMHFFRRCEYYGICNLNILHLAGVKRLEDVKLVDEDKTYDFNFSAATLLESLTTEEGSDVGSEEESTMSDASLDSYLDEKIL